MDEDQQTTGSEAWRKTLQDQQTAGGEAWCKMPQDQGTTSGGTKCRTHWGGFHAAGNSCISAQAGPHGCCLDRRPFVTLVPPNQAF